MSKSNTVEDKIREAGDVGGTAIGAIGNIMRKKPKTAKDILASGAFGSLVGLETGDGVGDMAGWMYTKYNKGRKKK